MDWSSEVCSSDLVDFDAVGLLGALERDLRVADLVGGLALVHRLDRAAERAIDADLQVADAERVVEAAANAARHFAHVGASAGNARRNGEFVAAAARQNSTEARRVGEGGVRKVRSGVWPLPLKKKQ